MIGERYIAVSDLRKHLEILKKKLVGTQMFATLTPLSAC